jgi:hypothetical protein
MHQGGGGSGSARHRRQEAGNVELVKMYYDKPEQAMQ